MHLTLHTDYALRTLVYLGLHLDKQINIDEITAFYDLSRSHLTKVVHRLGQLDIIKTQRGRSGGLQLVRDPATLRIGDIVELMEPDTPMVDCGYPQGIACAIARWCELRPMLKSAYAAFLADLNRHTLADVLAGAPPEWLAGNGRPLNSLNSLNSPKSVTPIKAVSSDQERPRKTKPSSSRKVSSKATRVS